MVMVWVSVVIAVAAVSYLLCETLVVRRTEHWLGTPDLSKFTVVQLSDLHGRTRFLNGTISEIVNRAQPDCVMITGDLVSRKSELNRVLAELKKIHCRSIYFVPGNYEREGLERFYRKRTYESEEYEEITRSLQEQGITVLENNGVSVALNEERLYIYGFDNSIYGNEQIRSNTGDWQSSDYVILLAHSPSIIGLLEASPLPYDLLLTGHTHGGQVRFLGRTIGAYKHFHVGLKRLCGRKHFYINRGLGTVKLPVRIACPPEIAVFHIGGRV